jgi:hypothetical protein
VISNRKTCKLTLVIYIFLSLVYLFLTSQKLNAVTKQCDESNELVSDLRTELKEMNGERMIYKKYVRCLRLCMCVASRYSMCIGPRASRTHYSPIFFSFFIKLSHYICMFSLISLNRCVCVYVYVVLMLSQEDRGVRETQRGVEEVTQHAALSQSGRQRCSR